MNELFDKMVENGLEMSYCEFEDFALLNLDDIIDALQAGGRPAERKKRHC